MRCEILKYLSFDKVWLNSEIVKDVQKRLSLVIKRTMQSCEHAVRRSHYYQPGYHGVLHCQFSVNVTYNITIRSLYRHVVCNVPVNGVENQLGA